MTSYKYLVTVTEEEANWLESHPEVSKSGLFQRTVAFLMRNEKTVVNQEDLEKITQEAFQ